LENIGAARANSQLLGAFLAVLKRGNVAGSTRPALVTGMTGYALTSMESGPNHLVDISSKPGFDGLRGFTPEEFGSLFAGRMEAALESLKAKGAPDRSADLDDLRREIFRRYGGYSRGGRTRVLNPYSTLFFLQPTIRRLLGPKLPRRPSDGPDPRHADTVFEARAGSMPHPSIGQTRSGRPPASSGPLPRRPPRHRQNHAGKLQQ
jgi:hypothetical protein